MSAAAVAHAWAPAADLATLRLRARLRRRVRAWFEDTAALEVDTPVLSQAAPSEPSITPLATTVLERAAWLQSSPEFSMKRLLAAGVGDCWQLARVFRDGERGARHQPEFELVEWYRVGRDQHALMDDVEGLLAAVLGPERQWAPAERWSYTAAFRRFAGVDPLTDDVDALRAAAQRAGADVAGATHAWTRDDWLDHLLTMIVAPGFPPDRPVFLHDWPASQAALARLDSVDPRVASRFELFWGELELANGFHELADAHEQRARFEADQRERRASGAPVLPLDENLLGALAAGLPDCAGVALGFDRLVMLAAGADDIDAITPFPFERA